MESLGNSENNGWKKANVYYLLAMKLLLFFKVMIARYKNRNTIYLIGNIKEKKLINKSKENPKKNRTIQFSCFKLIIYWQHNQEINHYFNIFTYFSK